MYPHHRADPAATETDGENDSDDDEKENCEFELEASLAVMRAPLFTGKTRHN